LDVALHRRSSPPDLDTLLQALDPQASLVQRHLWLMALLQWLRGTRSGVEGALLRVELLLDLLDARPVLRERFQHWWQVLLQPLDCSTLLSDYGFATSQAFITELLQRLHAKLLPSTPETHDVGELFGLVLPGAQDAQWIAALPEPLLERLAELLSMPQPVRCPARRWCPLAIGKTPCWKLAPFAPARLARPVSHPSCACAWGLQRAMQTPSTA
jgi:site-specific recombinase